MFSYTVTDEFGATSTANLTITITGTNDLPVANGDSNAGDAVVESGVNPLNTPFAGDPTAVGNVLTNDTDVDTGHVLTVAAVAGLSGNVGHAVTGIYGSVTIGADGSYTYTLDNADPDTQALAQGATVTDVFSYTVTDEFGATSTANLTITITGTNDLPVANGDSNAADAVVESGVNPLNTPFAGDPTAVGNVLTNDTDVDTGHVLTVAAVAGLSGNVGHAVTGIYGSVTIGADGSYTYTLDNTDPDTNALAQGATATDVFSYTVTDEFGATSTANLTITITGTNDLPVANGDSNAADAVVESGVNPLNTPFAGDPTAVGNVLANDTDVDTGHELSVAAVAGVAGNVGHAVTGIYGSVTIGANGSYTYTLDNGDPDTQALAQGATVADAFSYTVTDEFGATSTANLTVTITGTNDAPVASNDAISNMAPTGSGWMLNTDNGHYYRYIAASVSWATATSAASSDGSYLATITSAAENAFIANLLGMNGVQSGIWTSGQTTSANPNGTAPLTDTATYKWTAGPETGNSFSYTNWNPGEPNGGFGVTSAAMQIGHSGTWNDVPTSGFQGGYLEEWGGQQNQVAFREDTGTTLTTAQLLANDTDVDSSNLTITAVSASSAHGGTVSLAGNIVTYRPAADYNGADSFTYTVSDGSLTNTGTVSFNVTAVNDVPTIISATNAPTQALIVLAPTGPHVLSQGVNTNSLGLNTETFDGQSTGSSSNNGLGHGSFQSAALNAAFSGSGRAGVVSGSSSGVTAAPFVGPLPGHADQTHYLSIGAGGTETITFAEQQNTFGLYWGSVNSYNTIAFYNGQTLVASYTGADINPLFPTGNQGSFSSNGYVEFSRLADFNRVVLGTGNSNAFEIDNISAGSVHVELSAPISGTLTVSDVDIGDALTASVVGNATVHYTGTGSMTPADIAPLISASAVTFTAAVSSGEAKVLHWTYDPTSPDLDFLHAGETLTIKFTAQVNDGHGNSGLQPLTITLVGADRSASMSNFAVVNGTSGNDTFHNVGGNVTIFGGGGHDTFMFNAGFGHATIADFDIDHETINIDHTLFADVSDILAHATDVGADTVITDAANDTIILQGVTLAQVQAHAAAFHLV